MEYDDETDHEFFAQGARVAQHIHGLINMMKIPEEYREDFWEGFFDNL